MMQHCRLTRAMGVISVLALLSTPALADTHKTDLEGFQEVPTLSTTGTGNCRVKISDDETTIKAELSYSDLEGTVQQAHIHFGQPAINGGVVLFLCTNLGNGPAGTPVCPAPSGEVTRTLTSGDVIAGAALQGIAAGELLEVIDAIRAGAAYCNVHSSLYPGGEIRGQLQ
jgi:CHRD domain